MHRIVTFVGSANTKHIFIFGFILGNCFQILLLINSGHKLLSSFKFQIPGKVQNFNNSPLVKTIAFALISFSGFRL